MLLLYVTQGLAAGRVFELTSDVVRPGRAPGNDVALDDLHVSAHPPLMRHSHRSQRSPHSLSHRNAPLTI